MTDSPYMTGPFSHVSEMETPLATASDILKAIAFISETMDEDVGVVVQRMAWLALEQCKTAEMHRGHLFRLTHPDRACFEKEGWPS